MAVPKSTLESMGLVSMQPLSDGDGLQVRGEGLEEIGFVFGTIRFSIGASMTFSDISMKFADWAMLVTPPFGL
jgi:hypothetical protein